MTCKDNQVIESFNNAWRALCQQYEEHPNESTRRALNLLSKIIGTVESQLRDENKKEKQISIEEWIAWFKE